MHKLKIFVINSRKWLFVVITMVITVNFGSWTLIGSSNTAIAQTGDEGSEKTVAFNTFIIHLNEDGTLKGFESDRQEIKGTNEQLTNQFREVLKKFEDMSNRAAVNATARNVTFINPAGTNESAVVIPYANVTEQTYIDEFNSLLREMDMSGIAFAARCWEVITDGEAEWVHVHRCWSG